MKETGHGRPLRPQIRGGRLSGLLLGLAALALFCWHIGTPDHPYFDETHYVPAARALIEQGAPVNREHPLFAKTLVAAGIAVLGDGPLGWRLPIALCGALGIVAVFWIALHLFADLRAAVATALLVLFDQTYFIQARIAMLDMPMMACLLLGAGCLIHAEHQTRPAQGWRTAGAVFMGLAMGSKWLAAPYALLFLMAAGWRAALRSGPVPTVRIAAFVRAAVPLGLVMASVYFATFLPAFFYREEPLTLATLLPYQADMLTLQRGTLARHPYQSEWWQWPLMLRPIWYLFDKQNGAYEAILLVGNPVLYWTGPAAVLAAIAGWVKNRTAPLVGAIALYLGSVLIWAVIPKKIGFFYYYNFSAVLLCFVAVAFLQAMGESSRRWLWGYVAANAAMFAWFLPIISAWPLPMDDTWTQWVWMKSWY